MANSSVRQAPFQPGVTYSSTPPPSPTDGQFWIFPADATNGINWQFRYNAGSASAYKWEFVGGPPKHVEGSPGNIFSNLTLDATAGWYHWAGSDITLPRAGDYFITGTCAATQNSGTSAQISWALGDWTNHSAPLNYSRHDSHVDSTDGWANLMTETLVTGRAASVVVGLAFSGSGAWAVNNCSVNVTPVRVS